MKYLKKFNQHLNYNYYLTSSSYNQIINEDKDDIVSFCLNENEVHYDYYMPPFINGHEYVEIGGKKWATMNVGANSVTDTGLYFQWGDIQGYTPGQVGSGTGKKYFSWTDYKYCDGTSSNITKYNSTDGKTVLEISDDVARANWGGYQWRMPTVADYVALGDAVNTVWTDNYQGSSVAGIICTDKTDSSNVLFFPACSYCYEGNVGDMDGYYWSSSLYSSNVNYTYFLTISSKGTTWDWHYGERQHGYPIRAVAD